MEEIIFASGSVPVAVAARVYGKDASWIRAGIVSGWLPIGKATRSGKLVTNSAGLKVTFPKCLPGIKTMPIILRCTIILVRLWKRFWK